MKSGAKITEQVNAGKEKYERDEALEIVKQATEVWVAKGKKVVQFKLAKEDVSDEDLAKAILGPSGNLRAPVMKRGKKIYVGFHQDEFPALLS